MVKNTDLLCVSCDLGGAYMGLQLLEHENEVFKVNPNAAPAGRLQLFFEI
jgi:thiamine-monophosphate kinase